MPSPSVITLNAVAAAYAANDYLMATFELGDRNGERQWTRFSATAATGFERVIPEQPRRNTTIVNVVSMVAWVPVGRDGFLERLNDRQRLRCVY